MPTETDIIDKEAEVIDNGNENESVEQVPEKVLPWKQPKEVEQHVPYTRFKEVNDEKREMADRLRQAEETIRKFNEREAELSAVKEPTDLNPDDFPDVESYLKAFQDLTIRRANQSFEERLQQREQQREMQRAIEERDQNFVRNVHEAAKYNPEITNAVDYFAAMLGKSPIHPAIENEIMFDEHAGEIIYEITTDPELMREMYQGDPAKFIRKILKMSAKITREERAEQDTETKPVTGIANAVSKLEAIKASIPKTVRSSVTSGGKTLDKIAKSGSMAEYRAARAAQEQRVRS